MLRKLLAASAFLLFGASVALGEEETEAGRTLKMSGFYEAGYKVQNDFTAPSDMDGWVNEGAANRSKQPVTQSFGISFLAMADADGPVKYPEWLVLAQIKANPNNPDDDGTDEEDVGIGEAFLLWKPHMALNIKIGKQTLPASYNGTHLFFGPREFGFSKVGSITTNAAGLTIGAYLGSADHEAGFTMVNGRTVASEVYVAVTKNNFVVDEGGNRTASVWYDGKLFDKALHIVFAQQTVQLLKSYVVDSEIRSMGTPTAPNKHDQYGEYVTHTVTNLGLSYSTGFIRSYLGYWKISGIAPWLAGEDLKMEMTSTTIGFEMNDLGPGQLAFEYSTISTPENGDEGSTRGFIDFESVTALEYTIEMRKDISMRLTYQQLSAGDYWREGEGGDDPMSWVYDWTDTSMVAVSFKYEFE